VNPREEAARTNPQYPQLSKSDVDGEHKLDLVKKRGLRGKRNYRKKGETSNTKPKT